MPRPLFVLTLLVAFGGALAPLSAQGAPGPEPDNAAPPPPPRATIKPRTYTLTECLALAERNHPNLWAARARLAFVHAQLDEARYAPWFNWGMSAAGGVLPPITGSIFFTSTPVTARNLGGLDKVQPAFSFDLNGAVPLWTFGKITSVREAAEAQVRVSEWDMEKARQSVRSDVRRAYYGLLLTRDAKYIVDDSISRLKKGIDGLKEKLAKGERSVQQTDVLRLEVFYEEVIARSGEPARGAVYAMSALRFLTGVQTAFDVPDEPLKRPDRPLVDVAQYLAAARLFRPEINMARAGVIARQKWVDYNRAKFFPDIGLGMGASYATSPSATTQITAWSNDPFNRFFYYAGFGVRWNLDILPNAARVAQAEAQLEETRAWERLALGGTMVEVEAAYGIAVEAKGREEAWARAEQKAKQWIVTVQDSIDIGTSDERQLLDPARLYANAQLNHLLALMDLNVAMSELARVSGWDSAAPTGK